MKRGSESIGVRAGIVSMRGAWRSAGLVALGSLLLAGRVLAGPDEEAWVDRWMASATNLVTWHADVIQTRHLKALTQPLVSTGRVWFAAPQSFRWELGVPPQSIALRHGSELLLLSPRLRRAEKHSLEGAGKGPAGDMLALLDAGFPRDGAEFRRRFEIEGVSTNGGLVRLNLRPSSADARRWMPSFAVELDPETRTVRATELTFTDGSRLRNGFSNVVTNAPLPAGLFVTNLESGWKVTTVGGDRPK